MDTTKDELETDFDNLKDRFKSLRNDLEGKNSHLHELKNQLRLVTEREKHYLHEIDVLQSKEKPEVNKLRGKVAHLEEEYSQLKLHLDCELARHNEEFVRLQEELKFHSEKIADNSNVLEANSEDISQEDITLEKDVAVLHDEIDEKQVYMEALERKNFKLSETINDLRLELEQVKENVDYKKQDLVEAYDLMNTLQEDMLLAKTELESLKRKSAQTSSGNSLFAEVNDRRLQLQETLINLKRKCNEMKEEVSMKQKQIYKLRLDNDELTNFLKNDPLECRQDYETLITTYRDRISILENLSEDYQKLLSERQVLIEKGLPSNIVKFANTVIEEKRKHEEKLNEATGMEFRAQKMMSLELKETNLEVQKWKKMNEQLWNTLLELEDNIRNLKLQKNNLITGNQQKTTTDDHENSEMSIEDEDGDIKKPILKVVDDNNVKALEKYDKGGSAQEVNVPDEKKVTFTADTVDLQSVNKYPLRKGGKVLQCKTVHISTMIKKK